MDSTTPAVTATRTIVDRATAEKWLARNINRHATARQWNKFRDIILTGQWVEDGNPVRFDADGNLRDGQKRLRGLIAADGERPGITIPMLVVEGLAPDAQIVMDTGQKRSFAGWLEINGIHNAVHTAAAVKLLYAYTTGDLDTRARWVDYNSRNPNHADLWKYYLSLRTAGINFDEAHAAGDRVRHNIRMAPSVSAVAWIILSTVNRDDAAHFYAQLNLDKTVNPGEGAHLLIRVLNNQTRLRKYDPQAQLALTFKAWRMFRDAGTGEYLVWKPGGAAPETFPYPDDDIMFSPKVAR